MKNRTLAAILCLCGLAAFAVFWINRDPLARLTEPVGYIYTGIELFDAETGKPAVLEDYAFFGPMFAEIGNELARAAQQGYLMVDPDKRTASLVTLGISATAPLPRLGQESPFDIGRSGSGPIFLTYSRKEDRFTVRAPETALDTGLNYLMSFERAVEDINDRIEAQDELKAQREAALAEWNGAMDSLQAQLPSAGQTGPLTYRLNLPGDLGTIAAPMTAGLDSPKGNGFYLLIDRATGREWMGIRLDTTDEINRIFAANRKELLDPPSDDTRLLYEDKDTMVVARRGKPMFFERSVTLGDMGYLVRAEPEDGTQLATVWQIANSLSNAQPDPRAIPSPDFDALSWFAEQGLDLDIHRGVSTDLAEDTTERLGVDRLLARSPELRFSANLHPVSQVDDPFADVLFQVNLVCEPRLKTGDSPAVLHEEFSSNPVFGGLAHRDMGADEVASWIAQKSYLPDATFEFDPLKNRPDRGEPIWSMQSPEAAIGADKLSYFAYRARDLGGQFQMICASSSTNPYAAQAVLQIAERQELPDLSGLAPAIARIFGDYEYAALIGDTVYEARKAGDDNKVLLAADGRLISDIPFNWSWEFDDLRLFETGNLQDKHALWSFEGEQLLPYEYDEIDDNSDGTISVTKDGVTLTYTPSSRRLEPAVP